MSEPTAITDDGCDTPEPDSLDLSSADIPTSAVIPLIIEQTLRMRLRTEVAEFTPDDDSKPLTLFSGAGLGGDFITLEQDGQPTVMLKISDLFASLLAARDKALAEAEGS